MRIALVTPLFPTSAEPYRGNPIYQTALALQRWAEVEVFCPLEKYPRWEFLRPRDTRYNRVDLSYSPVGVSTHYFEFPCLPLISRPFNGRICARGLFPYLERYRPDVVLSYWIYPQGYAALVSAKKLGIPVIVGSRGSDLRFITDPLTRRMVKHTLRDASFVLTVSEDLRGKAILMGASPQKVRTLSNACDSSVFYLTERLPARRELGIAGDAELILFVGWIAQLKGVCDLLEAVEALLPTHPRLQLRLIGEGILQETLSKRSAEGILAGHVQLLGSRTAREIARWLAAANLLCLPSYSEGCPNVVIEALSCGRPVVGSNVGGMPELLNSQCGVLFPPGDVSLLCNALEDAFRKPWNEAAIASQFGRSWEDLAKETYEVCCAVLSGKGDPPECALHRHSSRNSPLEPGGNAQKVFESRTKHHLQRSSG